MNNFIQDEERRLRAENVGYALALGRDPKSLGQPLRKPAQSTGPTPLPPAPGTEQFIRTKNEPCEDCYGTGRDFGHPGHPLDAGDCSACGGIGMLLVTHNYLSEALQIAANPDSTRTVTRDHLVAVVQHARQFVTAAMILPDVKLSEVA